MIFPTLLAASALIATIAAAPVDSPVSTQGSKHVVYLGNCVPQECPIGICDPDDFNLVAAGYFANGPPAGNAAQPTALGTVSSLGSRATWEGTKRSVRLSTAGTFTSNIDKNAKKLAQGQQAGSGELTGSGATEPFVCFRDGATKFQARNDGDRYTCTADYYCPSIDVS